MPLAVSPNGFVAKAPGQPKPPVDDTPVDTAKLGNEHERGIAAELAMTESLGNTDNRMA